MDSSLRDSFLSMYFYNLFLPVVQREERTLASTLHANFHRDRNYNYLLSNTALVLSVASILLVLVEHFVDPCDS